MAGELGLGIGLSGKVDTARTLYLNYEQRKAQQEAAKLKSEYDRKKELDDQFQKSLKDFSLPQNYRWHRLLSDEAVAVSNDAVEKLLNAKVSGDPNWKNQAVSIGQEFNTRMAKLIPLNENYKHFDEAVPRFRYATENQKKVQNVFAISKDRFDLQNKLESSGAQSDRYLTLSADGYIIPREPVKIDLDKTISTAIERVKPVLSKTIYGPGPSGSFENISVKLRPYTKAEADKEFNQNRTLYGDNKPMSLEDMADQLLTQDEFIYQFADANKLDYNNPDEIKNALMEKLKFGVEFKQNVSYQQPRKTTININTGGPGDNIQDFTDIVKLDNEEVAGVDPTSHQEWKVKTYGSFMPQISPKRVPGQSVTASFYTADGKPARSNGKLGQTFSPNARFGGYVVLPYFNDGSQLAPVTESNMGNKKIQGFAVFSKVLDGAFTVYEYSDQTSLPNTTEGSEKERSLVLKGYRELKKDVAAANEEAKKNKPKDNAAYLSAFKQNFQK